MNSKKCNETQGKVGHGCPGVQPGGGAASPARSQPGDSSNRTYEEPEPAWPGEDGGKG